MVLLPGVSYREGLPQLDGGMFLTDGGIETTLIFRDGIELPEFAAFVLLEQESGTEALRRYFSTYAKLAAKHNVGLVLESPTWRANPDWASALGYGARELAEANRKAVALMEEVRDQQNGRVVVISGCIGPQGDGYDPAEMMSAERARDYHSLQVTTFAETAADMVTAITMTYADEAIGIVHAATEVGLPAVISFTVETDGRLPSGQTLGQAIEAVDDATGVGPAYFMLNCAHPAHLEGAWDDDDRWRDRIRGIRPNASMMSHAELDEASELDEGNPNDLARRVAALRKPLRNLNVIGGCCGTDRRHVDQMFIALG